MEYESRAMRTHESIDFTRLKEAMQSVRVVGRVQGHPVVRHQDVLNLHQAQMNVLKEEIALLRNALSKSCGDDSELVEAVIASQKPDSSDWNPV